jgi:hypothetical protein
MEVEYAALLANHT